LTAICFGLFSGRLPIATSRTPSRNFVFGLGDVDARHPEARPLGPVTRPVLEELAHDAPQRLPRLPELPGSAKGVTPDDGTPVFSLMSSLSSRSLGGGSENPSDGSIRLTVGVQRGDHQRRESHESEGDHEHGDVGVSVTPEFRLFLARLHFGLMFGRFAPNAEHRSIGFDETLLGGEFREQALRFANRMVASTADGRGDRPKQMFGRATYQGMLAGGGRRSSRATEWASTSDLGFRPAPPPAGSPSSRTGRGALPQ
jgi:hypothetical protein